MYTAILIVFSALRNLMRVLSYKNYTHNSFYKEKRGSPYISHNLCVMHLFCPSLFHKHSTLLMLIFVCLWVITELHLISF